MPLPILIDVWETERKYTDAEFARYVALALGSQGYNTRQEGKLLKSNAPAKVHQKAVDFVKAAHP
jgi:hypothetical protein